MIDKELDGRGGGWYRIPSTIIDIDNPTEEEIRQWLKPFSDIRYAAPKFYAKLMHKLLIEDYYILQRIYEHAITPPTPVRFEDEN